MPSNIGSDGMGTVGIGPWGGEVGYPWKYSFKGLLQNIFITSSDDVVTSIRFSSGDDQNGTLDESPVFGFPTGHCKSKIKIDHIKKEKLVLMEGIIGTFNYKETVIQLSFTTSKDGKTTKHGPYGNIQREGAEFSCPLSDDRFSGFHGIHSELLNSIGVNIKAKIRDVVPSWGSRIEGKPWSYTTHGFISKIFISYDKIIRAIRFMTVDSNGTTEEQSQTFGDPDPNLKFHEIKFETKSGKLNGIKGTYKTHKGERILTSLSFTNESKSFGPFGTRNGDSFEYKLEDNEAIAGFHGRSTSTSINAIGLYKRLNRRAENGVFVGTYPNGAKKTEGNYQPTGFISRIKLTFKGHELTSMCFESTDEFGKIMESSLYGVQTGTIYDIHIDAESGKLNCISGIFSSGNYKSIQSLSFSTDKKIVYGPYGVVKGEGNIEREFSIPVKDGFISGFGWNISTTTWRPSSYKYIKDLGVYINPK